MKYLQSILLGIIVCSSATVLAQSDDRIRSADTYLSRMEQFGFSGAVLIAENDQVLMNNGYGLANLSTGQTNQKDMIYSLGSIVKPFTATLIMKLVEDGELQLQESIDKYFDQVPSDKQIITIHHLLSHSSGLPGSIGSDTDAISKKEFIKAAMNTPLEFEPGERYLYSNVAFTLLAMIIEDVTGTTYENHLYSTILRPANMINTGYELPEWDRGKIANNYTQGEDNGNFLDRENYPTWNLIGNGGILSTTEDMFNFYKIIKYNNLLSAATKETMFTPVFMEDAYGWVNIDNGEIIQHNGGGSDGNGALFKWFPKDDMFLMIFTNSTFLGRPGFVAVEQSLTDIIFGDEVIMPPPLSTTDTEAINVSSGYFKLSDGASFEIKSFEKGFQMMTLNQQAVNYLFNPTSLEKDFSEWNNSLSNIIHNGLVEGNYESYEKISSNPDKVGKEILHEIEMEGYNDPKIKVLYSLLVKPEIHISKIAISESHFEGENMLFTMVFENDMFRGLGVDFGSAELPGMYFIQNNENLFYGYNFELSSGKKINLKINDENVPASLKFENSDWYDIEQWEDF